MISKLAYFIKSPLVYVICLAFIVVSCRSTYKEKWTHERAPDYFKARFETSKGNFEIEAKRYWSPMAVDRLYQLITHKYYTDMAVYRVIPNYIAQFGIHNDSITTNNWDNAKVVDEPVIEQNIKGHISFARGGSETRTTNLFINLVNNSPRLDTLDYQGVKGFPVVAKVTSGFEVIESFYDGYGADLDNKQDSIVNQGNAFLKKRYPKLDYIHKAYIIEKN